jgi:hypothetical protein
VAAGRRRNDGRKVRAGMGQKREAGVQVDAGFQAQRGVDWGRWGMAWRQGPLARRGAAEKGGYACDVSKRYSWASAHDVPIKPNVYRGFEPPTERRI